MKISHNQRLVLAGTVYIILFNIISNILAYFVRRFFVSNLGAYQYGMYTFFLSVVIMVNLLRDPGMAASLSVILPKEPFREYVNIILKYTFMSSIVVVLFTILFFALLDSYSMTFTQVVSVCTLIICMALYGAGIRILNGLEKHFLYAVRFVLINGALLVSVFFVEAFESMFLVYSCVLCFITAMAYYQSKKYLVSGKLYGLAEYFQMGIPITVYSMLVVILTRMDIVMIGLLLDAINVTDYELILSLAVPLTIFVSLTTTIFLPIFTRLSNTNQEKIVLEIQTYYTNDTCTFYLYFTLFPGFLFSVLYPNISLTTGIYSLVLGSVILYCLAAVRMNQLIARRKTKSMIYTFILIISINVVMNAVLIPRLGLYGAAISTFSSNMVLYLIYNFKQIRLLFPVVILFTQGFMQLVLIILFLAYLLVYELHLTKNFLLSTFIENKNK